MSGTNHFSDKLLAWLVHLYTASGILVGFMAVLAINSKDWRGAMMWLLLALFIDGTDGVLARKFRVREVLPTINGKTMDYVIDFANYAIIPAYFIYSAELVSEGLNLPLTLLILLVSTLYYARDGMVSEDFYFVGFPVMWNVVVFYLLFVFEFSPLLNSVVIVACAVMHFLPIKFAYPSRATRFKEATITATALVLIIMPSIVYLYPEVPGWLRFVAIVALSYFGILAAYDTFRKPSIRN